MKTTIKLISESGNVNSVVARFKELISTMPTVQFKSAEIRQKPSDFEPNNKKEKFYPLTLHTTNDVTVLVSEVRCGNNDRRAEALLEILKLAGFEPKDNAVEKILGNATVNIFIWNEKYLKQF